MIKNDNKLFENLTSLIGFIYTLFKITVQKASKYGPEKSPYLDNFYAVNSSISLRKVSKINCECSRLAMFATLRD